MYISPKIIEAFTTLGLEPGATEAQVKAAYKTLSKKYHPDLATNKNDAKEQERLNNLQAQLNFARAILQDYFEIEAAKSQVTPEEEDKANTKRIIYTIKNEIPKIESLIKQTKDLVDYFVCNERHQNPNQVSEFIVETNKYLNMHNSIFESIADKKNPFFNKYRALIKELHDKINCLEIPKELQQFQNHFETLSNKIDKSIDYHLEHWGDIIAPGDDFINEIKIFISNYDLFLQMNPNLANTLPNGTKIDFSKRIRSKLDNLIALSNLNAKFPIRSASEIALLTNLYNNKDDTLIIIKEILARKNQWNSDNLYDKFNLVIKNWDCDTDNLYLGMAADAIQKAESYCERAQDYIRSLHNINIGLTPAVTRDTLEKIDELEALIKIKSNWYVRHADDIFFKNDVGLLEVTARIFNNISERSKKLAKSDDVEDAKRFVKNATGFLDFCNTLASNKYSNVDYNLARNDIKNLLPMQYMNTFLANHRAVVNYLPKGNLHNPDWALTKFAQILILRSSHYNSKIILKNDDITKMLVDDYIYDANNFLDKLEKCPLGDYKFDFESHRKNLNLLEEAMNAGHKVNESPGSREFIKDLIENFYEKAKQYPASLTYNNPEVFGINVEELGLKLMPDYNTFSHEFIDSLPKFSTEDKINLLDFCESTYGTERCLNDLAEQMIRLSKDNQTVSIYLSLHADATGGDKYNNCFRYFSANNDITEIIDTVTKFYGEQKAKSVAELILKSHCDLSTSCDSPDLLLDIAKTKLLPRDTLDDTLERLTEHKEYPYYKHALPIASQKIDEIYTQQKQPLPAMNKSR
ncbi:MAG: J domain-containing protein [Clostridiales bacterium]|jgi:hypothetical protein|nr:J domain-containing protein [Clostridiales bacterium]